MSRLALDGGDLTEPDQHPLHGGARDVVAAHQIAFGHLFRQPPSAAVAGDRQKQAIGIGRSRARRRLAHRPLPRAATK